MSRPALAGAALLACVLLAGCGGSAGEADADAAAAHATAGEVASVACPDEATAVPLPAGWNVPLPAGAVPVDVRHVSGGRTIVTGIVRASESAVLHTLQRDFPRAGLKLTDGETEAHDAESNFTGDGVTGRWGIRELDGCAGPATRIDVVVRAS